MSRLLNEFEASEVLGIPVRTLRVWRVRGGGPVFRKLGRTVRYLPEDLTAFVDAGRRRSTSDAGPEPTGG